MGMFDREQDVIDKANELLASDLSSADEWRGHYRTLLASYDRLVRQFERLLKMSDCVEADLIAARRIADFHATHDHLTGIFNRGAILGILEKEIVRSIREKNPLVVIMLDLDRFKKINDEHGHLAGDAVLREVSARIPRGLRPYDSVGRYGGEEFVVICPGCGRSAAAAVGERIRALFDGKPVETAESPIDVTISLGVVAMREGEGVTVDTLIRCADEALYRAKNSGRNRLELSAFSGPA